MAPFPVCPVCANPAFDVEAETAAHFVKSGVDSGKKWALCSNPACDVTYFSSVVVYTKQDVIIPIWFKETGENIPICYCSHITKEEIALSAAEGNDTIKKVRDYTGKKITGQCKTKNPTGRCCKNAFLQKINAYLKDR